MNLNKKIAIIIINWNTYELTRSCIRSLMNCRYNDLEIFLVDNNSKDNSLGKLKKEFKKINYIINNKNTGFSRANNKVINILLKKNFDFIMLLNSDTEVSTLFLNPLIETFNSNKLIGAVQPLILNWDDKSTIWKYEGIFNYFFGLTIHKNKRTNIIENLETTMFTDWISGCCFITTPSILKEVGLLDEIYFAYFEDVDWSLRLRKKGYLLALNKNSIIYHHESGSSKSSQKHKEGYLSPKSHYYNFRNHIIFLRKHYKDFNFFGVILYQLFKILLYNSYFIIRFRRKKLINLWKGVYDGLTIKI